MRRIVSSLLLTFVLANTSLQADYDQIDYTNMRMPTESNELTPGLLQGGSGMFAIETNSDTIGSSKFNKRGYKNEKISFTGFDIDGSMIFYFNKDNAEAVNLEIGYNRTNIHWKENIYFSQSIFNTASISINGQTGRMCNWNWKGKISFNIDTDHCDIQEYGTWDCFLWGRYNFQENIGLHLGIIALTGMKIDHVYPIFGFDWILSEKWKVNAVFPVNLSVVYVIDDTWSVNIAGRAIETRYRTGKHENLSKGLVQYFNKGIELGVNYDVGDSIQANIHVGEMLGGRLKIANKHNDRPRHFSFKGAPYVGAEVTVRY
jgi:hypothetical protein